MKLDTRSTFLKAITYLGPFLLLPVHYEVRRRATYSHHHDALAQTHVAKQPWTKPSQTVSQNNPFLH